MKETRIADINYIAALKALFGISPLRWELENNLAYAIFEGTLPDFEPLQITGVDLQGQTVNVPLSFFIMYLGATKIIVVNKRQNKR